MGQYKCKIIEQVKIAKDIYCMTLEAAEITQKCVPGQFVHVRVNQGINPLLRRPFSIHRVHRNRGCIELLYRVVGLGSEAMAMYQRGHILDMMGPLGKGFTLDASFSHALIIAGGMGSAPVFFLMDALAARKKKATLFWGVKKGEEIFGLPEIEKSGVDVKVATEDGLLGYHGLVTDLAKDYILQHGKDKTLAGFVCGPKKMLKRVQEISEKTDFCWQVSCEERMACGIGVCMGCAVKVKQGGYKMVCSDGPVFDLREIVFDE